MESIIFRTLLHSLWQGVLLAALTALIVLFTTKASARVRYNLFVACLLLFVAGVGATFVVEMNQFNSAITESGPLSAGSQGPVVSLSSNVMGNTVLAENLVTYLSKYASSIVLIWFLIICAKSIRFMVDIRTLLQVRTSKVYHPGTVLTDKVNALAVQYGIKEKVQILQSGIIKVPMVLGHFKPLILVPLGLVNGLSMEEVDAILRHEMAHIKRRDYLVNLLQSIVEILFFFNPAVLWVANLIKMERENCCDDLAVSGTETKIDYIKALVSCQEFATTMPAYAMAVNGGKSQLVHRVQRLISSRNQSLNKLEKVIIGLVLISSVALTSAFSGKDTSTSTVPQTVIKQKERVNSEHTTAQMENIESGNESRYVDDSALIYNQLVKDGLVKANTDIVCTLDRNSFVINGVKQSDAIHGKYARIYLKPGQTVTYRWEGKKVNEDVQEAISVSEKANAATEKTIRAEMARAKHAEAKAIEAQTIAATHAQAAANQSRVKAVANARAAQTSAMQTQAKAIANADKAQTQAIIAQKKAMQAQTIAVKKARNGNEMTNELIADGLVNDKTNFSYQLNIDELVVDGAKQSDLLHRKYRRKYLKNANQRISTSVSTN